MKLWHACTWINGNTTAAEPETGRIEKWGGRFVLCEGGSGDRTGFVVCVMLGVVRMALSAVDLCGLLSTWRLKFDSFCLHYKKLKNLFKPAFPIRVPHWGSDESSTKATRSGAVGDVCHKYRITLVL